MGANSSQRRRLPPSCHTEQRRPRHHRQARVNRIPPQSHDIIIIRPAWPRNQDTAGRIRDRFRKDIKVSRSKITTWLQNPEVNHFEYSDIKIGDQHLSQLLEDGYVDDAVLVHEDHGSTTEIASKLFQLQHLHFNKAVAQHNGLNKYGLFSRACQVGRA